MLLSILRWLKGYVWFDIKGRYPERFINVVVKNGLSVWNTGRKNDDLCACMYINDYKHIRKYAKKGRVTLKVTKRSGFPFFVKEHKNRVGVIVGLAVFIAVVAILSNFVWTIEISGLQTISEAQVLSSLSKNGLYIGRYKNNASFKVITRDTMLDIRDIGWMSINVVGSHASVEIKEKAKSPKIDDYLQPANVKASRDGLIVKMNVSEGEKLFDSGSAVVKDQLLVSSVVEDMLGGVTLVRADAQVIAQTNRSETFTIPKSVDTTSYDLPQKRYMFDILSLKIPLSFSFADDSGCLIRYDKKAVELFDTVLPLSVTTQTLYTENTSKKILSEKEAEETLRLLSLLYEAFELEDCTVLDRKYELSQTDGCYVLKTNFSCEEDIAYQQDINIEKAFTDSSEAYSDTSDK